MQINYGEPGMASIVLTLEVYIHLSHDANMMLPLPCFMVGMVFFRLPALPPCPPDYIGHYSQTIQIVYHQTRGHLSKKLRFDPMCSYKAFFQPYKGTPISVSFYCAYTGSYFCTRFLDCLHKILCCCSGNDLLLFVPKYIHY